MSLSRRAFAHVSLAALAACATRAAAPPDLVLAGGPIHTGRAELPLVEAVRVRAGKIVFAGALDDALNGPPARRIDLAGAAAFPGFVDSHCHLLAVGLAAMQLDLVGVASIAELAARLAAYAAAHPDGPIIGRGWIETHWPEARFPSRADIDAVVADRPVLLGRIDGHAALVNSAALAAAGIDANTPDPPGGRIERDAAGAPTGMLIDAAAERAERAFPAPTPAMKREAIAAAARLYAARGWTGFCEMGASLEDVALFEAQGESLPLRADLYASASEADAVIARGPYGAGRVHLRGLKLYVDGALGSRGAALLAPYADAPGDGLLVTPVDRLRDIMRRARAARVQIAAHAIGDRANRIALDLCAEAFAGAPAELAAARWRIEHAQVIAPEDIPRFAALGVIASMQPSHAISDLHFAPARLGPDRLAGAYAWRALLETGARICAGSDAPVEKGDPLIEFYAAVHRHDLAGFAGPDWRLDQAVPRAAALAMLTRAGAHAAFAEASRGVIAPGMDADISVFSADLMTAGPADIPAARALFTLCAGEITHDTLSSS